MGRSREQEEEESKEEQGRESKGRERIRDKKTQGQSDAKNVRANRIDKYGETNKG